MKYLLLLFMVILIEYASCSENIFDVLFLRNDEFCYSAWEKQICVASQSSFLGDVWGACHFRRDVYISMHGNDETCDTSYMKLCRSVAGIERFF